MWKRSAAYLFILFTPASARVDACARKRSSAQDTTKFNGAELLRFTPANASNSANHVPVSRIEFAADRSCNYVRELALANHRVGVIKRTWSRSKCSRDPAGQTEFFVQVAVFWLVDDVIEAYLAVFRLFTDLITNSTRLQSWHRYRISLTTHVLVFSIAFEHGYR